MPSQKAAGPKMQRTVFCEKKKHFIAIITEDSSGFTANIKRGNASFFVSISIRSNCFPSMHFFLDLVDGGRRATSHWGYQRPVRSSVRLVLSGKPLARM